MVHTYYDNNFSKPSSPLCYPWDLLILSKSQPALTKQESRLSALRAAVTDFETRARKISGHTGWFWFYKQEYSNGLAAYDAWATDLGDDDGIGKLPPDQYTNYWQGTAWMYDVLHHARSAAYQFLRRCAEDLSGTARNSAMQAGSVFKSMSEHMEQHWRSFPYRAEGYVKDGWKVVSEQDARSHGQKAAYCTEWTREMRQEAVAVLRRLKEYDQEALTHLKRIWS